MSNWLLGPSLKYNGILWQDFRNLVLKTVYENDIAKTVAGDVRSIDTDLLTAWLLRNALLSSPPPSQQGVV
jgi:hypothetical protein